MRPHILHPRPPQQPQLEPTSEHPCKPARPRNVRPEEPGGDVTVHAHLVHAGTPASLPAASWNKLPSRNSRPVSDRVPLRGLLFRQRKRVESAPQVLLLVRSFHTARERQRW